MRCIKFGLLKIFKRIDSYEIGILTLRLFKNYGGILQNYALSRFLQKNGYDVETINIVWSYQLNGVKKYFVRLKRLVRNMLIGKWYSLDEEKNCGIMN